MREINKRVILLGVVLTVSVVFLIGFANEIGADPEPEPDKLWYINESEDITITKDYELTGNVIVNGTLTIDGFTLTFDCDPDVGKIYSLQVNSSGSLIMTNNAKITAKDLDKKITDISIYGNADIQNSEIAGVQFGIICKMDSSCTITNNDINNCDYGIIGEGVTAPDGGTFTSVTYDITQFWYLKVKVENTNGETIVPAKVRLIDSQTNEFESMVDDGGIADLGLVKVKEGTTNFNQFTIEVEAHEDETGTSHVTARKENFDINNNIDPEVIVINNALDPDFSIRGFSAELSLMDLGETNKLTVTIRNMGEVSHDAQITYYAKLQSESEDNYQEIGSEQENIPAKTAIPHHDVKFDWDPTEAGNYDVKVEVSPSTGTDAYTTDDNSPLVIGINVMQPTELVIESPEEGDTLNGEIIIEGIFKGTYDWIHVWLNDDETNFSEPHTIVGDTWICNIDSGAFNGVDQKINSLIKGQNKDGVNYVWYNITVTLDNAPRLLINSPENNGVLQANNEDYEEYIWGNVTKATVSAPDITSVELTIGGIPRTIILEKEGDTVWNWHYDWNIAQISNPVKDGSYTITAQAEDELGRKSDIIQITISVDNYPPFSMVTVPGISITTAEPTEAVNDQIVISGTVEDDWEVKRIEAQVGEGDWITVVDEINSDNATWEYTWDVSSLDKGAHTINFRAIDEEENTEIIDEYYLPESFNIIKESAILPDLTIDSVNIMKGTEAVTNAKNGENLTIEVTIKVINPEEIPQETTIYLDLKKGEDSLETVEYIIDSTSAETFTLKINWTAAGTKGPHNLSLEIDKGDNLAEGDENNNVKKIDFEMTDDPPVIKDPKKDDDDGFIPSIGTFGVMVALIVATSIVIFVKRKK